MGAGPDGLGQATPATPEAVAERLRVVRQRIAARGRDPATVTVVAVTKGFGPAAAAAALAAGIGDLGENYVQELLEKAAVVAGARWHLIGPPQRNKIARAAPAVHLWEAVDRAAVLDRLAAVRPGAHLLVQVNATGEAQKAGCPPEGAAALVRQGRDLGLDVRGLMCVGPAGDPAGARRAFRRVAELGRTLGLPELSMGMSNDFELAVECGATIVRLGQILLGPRRGRDAVPR